MKKNKLILLQLIIAFTLICTSVYAAVDTTIAVSTSSTTLHKGDEFTVTLALEKVDSSKKVESVEGYINYNKDILETITVDSIEKTASGTVKIGDEELPVENLTNKDEVSSSDAYVAFNGSPSSGNDIKLVIDFKNGVTSDLDLLKIKFKVKADADLGTVTNAISYEMFQITAGAETLPDITKNINLTVVSEQPTPTEHEHKWKENTSKSKAATCTEEGYKFYECTEEDCTETKKETVKATGHKFGDWKVTKEATTKAEGEKQRECSVCKYAEKQKIEKKASTNTNKTKNNTNTNTNKNTNKANNTNTNVDNTVSGTKIPAAGSKVVILPAVLLIVLAYVSYNKYMKYKDI